jgi:hypothetical protein
MKIKEYDEMMRYLTRPKAKETKRSETTMERINRIGYEYGEKGFEKRPPHMDNKNIVSFEDQEILKNNVNKPKRKDHWKEFVKTGKLPEVTKEESERLKADRRVKNEILKNYKTETTPVKIDISGINTDLNVLENSMYAPSPQRSVPKEEKLEGIETILGIKHK